MIYSRGSQRSCQRGAGGNAIAMTNRAVLECQARAWGPSALLGLSLLSNHSTVNVGWVLFLIPPLQLRALGLELLSVESKGTNSDQARTWSLCSCREWEQEFPIQACAELPSPTEAVLVFALGVTLLAPEVNTSVRSIFRVKDENCSVLQASSQPSSAPVTSFCCWWHLVGHQGLF